MFGSTARWSFWSEPARVRLLVVAVEAVAIGLAVATLSSGPPTGADLALGGWILLLGMAHIEAATGIERIRRRVTATAYFDLSSVWTFAAALLLPAAVATGVVVVLYAHLWLRVWKPARVPLYRLVYTTATVVLAAVAAHAVVLAARAAGAAAHELPALGWIALAALVYLVVNNMLVVGAVALGEGLGQPRTLLGGLDDHVLELATLCLGAMVALVLTADRWTAALALAPLLVLQRAVQVRQLEEAATTDQKTGLLNTAAWRSAAARRLERADRSGGAAVLIADLDHFKSVNDTHGHLVGDAVLAAVAAELRAEVRQHDLVARFGGEEFVVLLTDLTAGGAGRREVLAVAERIRARVAGLGVPVPAAAGPVVVDGLSISIGAAMFPEDGEELEKVLAVADESLYAAKDAGRNTVRIASGPVVPQARRSTDDAAAPVPAPDPVAARPSARAGGPFAE
ncbi:GGDEF domain-containing protein [Pseudonocardia benzenivorans]|uniref:GGDEF domain-containing protein n=1 Tax=Pseudonocardia benzenivorans TaxID=228005 RepID=A0ABW3VS87_9PSEU